MDSILVFPGGSTAACGFAADCLRRAGIALVDHPSPEVTHLLLDVPSFGPDGSLRGGGRAESLLERLPPAVTVVGGNLNHPALKGYPVLDLLTDAGYLAQNAAITAECALQAAAPNLTAVLPECPTLVIGWGRIGKCLGRLLKSMGAEVTIAARKEADRAMLRALGFEALDTARLDDVLPRCRLIFNTVPQMLLPEDRLKACKDCVKIDLASQAGMAGPDVLWARGLPGKLAPGSSGRLIAKTFLKLSGEGTL